MKEMKNLIVKAILVQVIFFSAWACTVKQVGYEEPVRRVEAPLDSVQCLRNYALYTDRHRQKKFEDALPLWRTVFNGCPLITVNIYHHGIDIISHMIEKSRTEEEKLAYLDTAMMVFDRRIEYFGDRANVLGRKGTFYFLHNNKVEDSKPGYDALAEAIRLSEDNPSPAVVITYMNITIAKFRAGMLDNEDVIETYTYLTEILDNIPAASQNSQIASTRETVEGLFTGSGVAGCDALIRIYGEKLEQSPQNTGLLAEVLSMLTGAGCSESELFLDVTKQLHTLDPSPRSALNLSAIYRSLDNYDQVIRYLKEAIDLQKSPTERGTYYLELALLTNQVKKERQLSCQYAMQALSDNPGLGRAHLHIGSLYASDNECFAGDPESAFKNRTVFWAAVDRFNEAKRVDPALTAEANRLIETYSLYFPDMETIFFHEFTEGETYLVGCWINEATLIRARKR
jgi:tetratricopeptide (TPR) repeat protein